MSLVSRYIGLACLFFPMRVIELVEQKLEYNL